jgi:glycosyltransferase involved in cell wall biosynthesis
MSRVLNGLGGEFRHTIVAVNGNFSAASWLSESLGVSFGAPPSGRDGFLRRIRKIRDAIGALRPDLLLTYNWGSIEWAMAHALSPTCPHLHLESGFGPEEGQRQLRRRIALRRLALARCDGIVVPSHQLQRVAAEVWKFDSRKISLVPNGVDCETFAAQPDAGVIPGFEKESDEVVVGLLAPLRPEKNVGRLLRAFAAIAPKVPGRLLIIGGGPQRVPLTRLAAEIGVAERVVWAGHVEAPARVLRWVSVLALSSDTEQMPNCVLQGMAASLPVASVDVGDVKLMVSAPNRPFVTPLGDDDAFASSLLALMTDEQLRRRVGQANADHVRRHYPESRMIRRYGSLFTEALAGRRNGIP